MDARDLIQLRSQWIMEDLNSSPPSSPPHAAFIENDDDHWMFPQPTSNQESRVRHSGPELARIFENFAEIDAKISKALFQAEQRNWDAICKRRSKLQNETMLTEEKNQLDLKAALPKEDLRGKRVDQLKEGKIREALGRSLEEEDTVLGKKRKEMGRSLEEEDAALGKKRKITGRKYRDISEIVAEVMEAKKAMEMEGIPI